MKKVRRFKCISIKGDNTLSGGFEVGEVYEFIKEDCSDNMYALHIGEGSMWGDISDFEEVTEEESLQLKVERLKMELKETENTLREKEKYTRVVPIEELKENVWYTYTDIKGYLMSFTDVVRGLGYGFSAIVGNWVEYEYFLKGKLRRATEKEVETILFRIAKQKGFVEGVKFNNVGTYVHGQNTGVVGELKSNHPIVLGLSTGNQWIMWKGKWSTPIKETKLPTINGYEGHLSVDNKYLVYGCAILPINWFIGSKTRQIKNLTLSSGVQISTTNMNAIRAYLEYKKC